MSSSVSTHAIKSQMYASKAAFQPIFLEFSPNLYYPLKSDAEINMASELVFLFHTHTFDDDDWIKENQEIEEDIKRIEEETDEENDELENTYE